MAKQYNINSCESGDLCWVRGRVTYSRVKTQIAGQELEEDKKKRLQRNLNPIDRPYSTITIKNAEILFDVPGAPTLFENYIQERFFQSNSHPEYGWCYTGINKGKYCPAIGVMTPGTNVVNQIVPEGELATDLDVTLVLRVYATSRNKGVSLDSIIVNGEVKYFSGGQIAAEMASRGIIFNAVPQPEVAPVEAAPVQQDYVAPTPAPMGAPAPTATPFMAQAPQAPQAPVAPAPAPSYAPVAPAYTAPVQQIAPAPMPSEAGGVRYNPQDRGY